MHGKKVVAIPFDSERRGHACTRCPITHKRCGPRKTPKGSFPNCRGDHVGSMNEEKPPSRRQIAEAKLWAELDRVCRRVHESWYKNKNRNSGERFVRQLDRILKKLPENDVAIVRQDALGLFRQLQGDNVGAIKHRQEEIRLIEQLHDDVRRNLDSGKYTRSTAEYVLEGRDVNNLNERRAMLRAIEEEIKVRDKNSIGVAGVPPAGDQA